VKEKLIGHSAFPRSAWERRSVPLLVSTETVNAIKLRKGWVSDSVTQQVFEKWWITLALIHPTKDKTLLT